MKITKRDIAKLVDLYVAQLNNSQSKTMGSNNSYHTVMALDSLITGFNKELKTEIFKQIREKRTDIKK